jgi:hypothetical protein
MRHDSPLLGAKTMKLISMVCCAALILAACETTAETRLDSTTNVGEAAQQPLRDLRLIRDEVPPILLTAAMAPYVLPSPVTCDALHLEIVALDQVLGPDLDRAAAEDGDDGQAIAADLIGGAVSLPFGGIVRRLTGASEREREIRLAILSGLARRSYFKGAAHSLDCDGY